MTITRIFTHSAQHGAQMLAFTWVSSLPKNSGSVIASPWFPQRTHWTCAILESLRRDSSIALNGKENVPVLLTLTPRRARARNGVAACGARVAKWQTQRTQNPPVVTPWEFDPPPGHQVKI